MLPGSGKGHPDGPGQPSPGGDVTWRRATNEERRRHSQNVCSLLLGAKKKKKARRVFSLLAAIEYHRVTVTGARADCAGAKVARRCGATSFNRQRLTADLPHHPSDSARPGHPEPARLWSKEWCEGGGGGGGNRHSQAPRGTVGSSAARAVQNVQERTFNGGDRPTKTCQAPA